MPGQKGRHDARPRHRLDPVVRREEKVIGREGADLGGELGPAERRQLVRVEARAKPVRLPGEKHLARLGDVEDARLAEDVDEAGPAVREGREDLARRSRRRTGASAPRCHAAPAAPRGRGEPSRRRRPGAPRFRGRSREAASPRLPARDRSRSSPRRTSCRGEASGRGGPGRLPRAPPRWRVASRRRSRRSRPPAAAISA